MAEPALWLKDLSWTERRVGWEEQGDLLVAELLQESSLRLKELKKRERKI